MRLQRDRVPATDAGKQFPERGQNAIGGRTHGGSVLRGDVLLQQSPLGRGMFAVGFDVDAEIAVALRIVESVMPDQPVDLRFRNRRDLAFVGVKRGEALCDLAFAANGTEGRDQIGRFRPGFGVVEIVRRDAEGGGEVAPELRMIRVRLLLRRSGWRGAGDGSVDRRSAHARPRDRSGRRRRADNIGGRNRPAFPCSIRPRVQAR